MNREDIIRMAREAGFVIDEASRQYQPKCIGFTHYLIDDELERFAALVAAAAKAEENEACAKVADRHSTCKNDTPDVIAVAIRARGQE